MTSSKSFGFLRKIPIMLKTRQMSAIFGPTSKLLNFFLNLLFFFSMLLVDRHLKMVENECFEFLRKFFVML